MVSPKYTRVEHEFDLQGEIDIVNSVLKKMLENLDEANTPSNAKEIKKALMDTLIHSI